MTGLVRPNAQANTSALLDPKRGYKMRPVAAKGHGGGSEVSGDLTGLLKPGAGTGDGKLHIFSGGNFEYDGKSYIVTGGKAYPIVQVSVDDALGLANLRAEYAKAGLPFGKDADRLAQKRMEAHEPFKIMSYHDEPEVIKAITPQIEAAAKEFHSVGAPGALESGGWHCHSHTAVIRVPCPTLAWACLAFPARA